MNNQLNSLITAWMEKGDHDLGSAKIIFQYIPEYSDTIAFHCQQAVEKYLKAALVFKELEFQKTHDLLYLLELLSRTVPVDSSKFDKAIMLNNFAVEIRYPNQTIHLTREELVDAIKIAEEFRDFVVEFLQL